MIDRTSSPTPPGGPASPHDGLREREEVLEICYWYKGEGLGEAFTPDAVQPFLPLARERIAEILAQLHCDGALEPVGKAYHFTESGAEKASRLFHETFAEFQTPSHYECNAGCCDSEDDCDHDHADHAHAHNPHGG